MDNSKKSSSDARITPCALIVASLIVAIWLAAFAFGYEEGKDLGSILFSTNDGA